MTSTITGFIWLTFAAVSIGALTETAAASRTWTAADGEYSFEAELIAFNDRDVVLQRADHDLAVIPREQLSEEDREFLASDEAGAAASARSDAVQTWTLRDGTKFVGRIVDFARRDMTIQRRRRRIYVNDRVMNNLPEFYQQLVPAIVAHYENLPRADLRSLGRWLGRADGAPHIFKVEGVVVETENGDEYGVPFFLFSDDDMKLLQAGWDEWQAVPRDDYEELEDQSFLLQTLAAARQADADVKREIALMQLKLQAVEAGVTSLWEVTLWPADGFGGPPIWAVVPGRDSRQATDAALQLNPGYVAGPVRRVSRR